MIVAAFLALLLATASPPTQETTADPDLITTRWSLDRAGKRRGAQVQQQPQAAQPRRQARRAAQKPRLYGGAGVTNARREKGRGQVGVQLPF